MMYRILIFCVIAMTGCASSSRFNLDVPLSSASAMATESSVSNRSVSSSPKSGFYSRATVSGAVPLFDPFDPYWYGSYDHRLLISRQTALNMGVNKYNLLDGYGVSYAARMDDQEFHFSVFFSDIEFQSFDDTEGLTDPLVFGLNINWHKLFPAGSMAFVVGGRLSFTRLAFGYENDIVIDGMAFDSDSIGAFGIGMPMGAQWDIEPFTFELLAVPTIYLHEGGTSIGFINDVVTFNSSMPLSFGVGFTF